jgi:hypothetical protein
MMAFTEVHLPADAVAGIALAFWAVTALFVGRRTYRYFVAVHHESEDIAGPTVGLAFFWPAWLLGVALYGAVRQLRHVLRRR